MCGIWVVLLHGYRIQKELVAYEKEVVEQAAKVQRMRDEQQDEYDIKKQVCGFQHLLDCHSHVILLGPGKCLNLQTEVLAEGEMMIPNTKQRLTATADDLSAFLVRSATSQQWADLHCT